MSITYLHAECQDCASFLELIYTGKVSMEEHRRPGFTSLLELLAVNDDIGECVTFQPGLERDLGGGVTIQRWNAKLLPPSHSPLLYLLAHVSIPFLQPPTSRVDRNRAKPAGKPIKKSTNISVNIEPVTVTPRYAHIGEHMILALVRIPSPPSTFLPEGLVAHSEPVKLEPLEVRGAIASTFDIFF